MIIFDTDFNDEPRLSKFEGDMEDLQSDRRISPVLKDGEVSSQTHFDI